MKFRVGKRKVKITADEVTAFLFGALVVGAVWATVWVSQQQTRPNITTFHDDGITAAWIPDTVKRWQEPINESARRYNIDPNLIAIIMTLESGGHTKANSGVAKGLMQVTDYTGGDIAAKFLRTPRTEYDLFDPATSIEFGTAYLAYLRDTFCTADAGLSTNECIEVIAAGYNGGPGAAGSLYRGEGLGDMQTVGYSRDAYHMWRERNAATSPTYLRWAERGGQSLVDAAKAE